MNSFSFEQELVSAQIHLKKAQIDLQNVLIGQGYTTLDSTKIPNKIFDIATIKSGYAEALQSLKAARFKMESSKLVAPFSGKLANIVQKQFEQVIAGKTFCTLIDDSEFEAVFHIVESEVKDIHIGAEVKIIPFSDQTIYTGIVTEINPMVDENGLINGKARAKNPGNLIDGMNVKVIIEKEIPDQMVVPKSAVLLRDNQQVLFRCVRDSVAFWTYVQITGENTTSYAVIPLAEKDSKLNPGDTIIVSGNLNLAHESKVSITKTKNPN